MLVEQHNVLCVVKASDEKERRWLSSYLSFEDSTARFRNRGRRGGDDRIRLFNVLNNTYPAGLHELVVKAARKKRIKFDTLDKRVEPCPVDEDADLAWLRDYQAEAVEVGLEESTGIIWAPTGSGKTEIAAALVKCVPCRWLFLVHRKGLVNQTADRYELRTGERPFIYQSGAGLPNHRFVVTTFQTLYSGLKQRDPHAKAILEGAQGLLVDEVHVLPAGSFYRVSMFTKNAYYRIGLSGTPLARGDKRSLMAIAAVGPVIYRIKPELLIEAGVLAKPRIRMIEVYQESEASTYQGAYGECIVRSATRNKAIVDAAKRATKPCLVFVREIKHGKLLIERLKKADVSCEFVWGSDSESKRTGAIKKLEYGEIEVLVASVVFQEGVDIPSLASVVIGSGGKSVIAALQRIGRGMRTNQGTKTEFEVWDILDKGQRWLQNHSRARMRTYAREGYETATDSNVYRKKKKAKGTRP